MRSVAVLLAVTLLAACAAKKPVIPAGTLWEEGNAAMNDGAYELAVDKYKALLDQYPFDENAEQAELKIAQAYYYSERYPEAIAAFADFERMHPTSPNLAEIEYRRGMAYVAQHKTADRDTQAITQAMASFKNIADRYPNTPWADRARLRIQECRAILADHDAGVAEFYLKRGSLRAAESRLSGLLRDYPESNATADALYEFAKAYAKRDEPEEATLALATLAYHHPNTPLGVEAKQQLGDVGPTVMASDPLPRLVDRIQAMSTLENRLDVPSTVSAYPDKGQDSGPKPLGGGY
jgi:outer membrane protein assembly factor BamD